ncbi:elongation factor P [Aquisalinus flavus]|uniref:Elongation factor P n=1 Tax=Aquisalinus flavus TaxID=1526572 RepID=A0A8J2Y7X3_9PROT|nr:elongation factor P [Aquisalinus flavus]MBD0426350.1 elongation factor P [Aquisalinus flavus]UNE48084.1 elongation factor P [Aquisalinus flavus]GGD08673.1 elongation factor P [Aquisalinus flavus]
MKINGNEVRPGNVIQHQDSLWVAVRTEAVKPGKGPAYAQVELKNLLDGRKLNERFRASETVERVRLEQKDHTYLYKEGELLIFMDSESYEQISIPADMIGERTAFLQDNMPVVLDMHEGTPIGVQLPQYVTLEIVETEPTVKGQTASSSYKPAITDNGVRVMVPPYMTTGERIVVDTETVAYVKRAE